MQHGSVSVRVLGRAELVAPVRELLAQHSFQLDDAAGAVRVWAGPASQLPADSDTPSLVITPAIGPAELELIRSGGVEIVTQSASAEEVVARVERLTRAVRSDSHQFHLGPLELEMFLHLPDGAAILDEKGIVLALNPVGQAVLGHPERFEGVSWKELARPLGAENESFVAELAAYGRPMSRGPTDVVLHNGETVALAVSAGHLPHSNCPLLLFRDVTAQRSLDTELRRTTDFLEHLIESSSDAILAADLQGRLIVYNRASERLFGFPANEAKAGVNVRELYPHGGAQEVMRLLRESPTGHIDSVRTYGKTRTGETVPVELSAALLKMNGHEIGSVGLLRDIRERVRVESELARTRARLIDAEKQRDITALAGATAHELNQPLTVIFGRIDLLLRKADEPIKTHLQAVVEQAERMAEIVKRVARLTHIRPVAYPGERVIADLDVPTQPTPGPVVR